MAPGIRRPASELARRLAGVAGCQAWGLGSGVGGYRFAGQPQPLRAGARRFAFVTG